MKENNTKSHFMELMIKAYEGRISPDEIRVLNESIKTNPEAAKCYVEFFDVVSGLIDIGDVGRSSLNDQTTELNFCLQELAEYEKTAPMVEIVTEEPAKEPVKMVKVERPQRVINKFSLYTAIISAAALFFAIIYVKLAPVNTVPVIGKLTRTVGAQWQDASGQITQGCDLYAGPVKLLRGLAEVRFDNGVKMIIEGPAEVEFESLERIYLGLGNVVVNISATEDKQFAVRTDNCSIVDYGTEFGTSVLRDGRVRVDVFEGSVSLRDSFNPLSFNKSLLLKKGERGEVERDGQLSKTTFKISSFVRENELDINAIAQNNSYYRWKAYNCQLHRDPDLVAHYTFEKDRNKPDVLIDSAPATAGLLNGILGGPLSTESSSEGHRPEWITGRWPNKTALSFKDADSRVVIPVNDVFQLTGPITLCAWINFSGENKGGAIIDCRDEFKINYHLYLQRESNTEVMEFRRYYATKLEDRSWSVDVLVPEKTWSMVSVTHDNKFIRYYLNGDLVGKVPYEFQAPQAGHGDLIIGNALFPWASPFGNDIGEVAILKRAMSPDEIREMYLAGCGQ